MLNFHLLKLLVIAVLVLNLDKKEKQRIPLALRREQNGFVAAFHMVSLNGPDRAACPNPPSF